MDTSLDSKPGLGDRSVGSRLVGRLVVLSIAAVVVLSLSACGNGKGASESSSKTSGESSSSEPSSSGAALLPRDVIIPLSTVKEVLPEMTQ